MTTWQEANQQRLRSIEDYEARNDADTLIRAGEIRRDGKRHKRAQHHVRKKFGAAADALAPRGKASRFTARAKLRPAGEFPPDAG